MTVHVSGEGVPDERPLLEEFVAALDEYVTPLMMDAGWARIGSYVGLSEGVLQYAVGYEADEEALERIHPGAHVSEDEDWYRFTPTTGQIETPWRGAPGFDWR